MEMMIVLGIIALLVGIGATVFTGIDETAKIQGAKAQIKTIETGLMSYKVTALSYPSEVQGLRVLVERPAGSPVSKNWRPVMKPTGIIDPWGNPFGYKNPGRRNTAGYDIYSLGEDGKDGTDDDIYTE